MVNHVMNIASVNLPKISVTVYLYKPMKAYPKCILMSLWQVGAQPMESEKVDLHPEQVGKMCSSGTLCSLAPCKSIDI